MMAKQRYPHLRWVWFSPEEYRVLWSSCTLEYTVLPVLITGC